MNDNHVILSIIITTYNQQDLTEQLLDILAPQLVPGVEITVIDDGSANAFKTKHSNIRVIRKRNGGVSTARNRGIKESHGEYIAIIDGDDLVSEHYISRILQEISEHPFDVCDLSWKSTSNSVRRFDHLLRTRSDRLPNPSASTRVFNRAFIGDVRFNENKDSTEDEDFTRHLGVLTRTNFRHTAITEYLYFYRADQGGSKSKKFAAGLLKTRKIVYYYQHVTADMTDLLEEIKQKDEQHEVWLMTEQCDIPVMDLYCQIKPPHQTWAHEFYGEPYPVIIHQPPIETQIVIYSEHFGAVSGITSFTYNFCQNLRKYYDITVMYGAMDPQHVARFSQIVRTVPKTDTRIACDVLIINRLNDPIPDNVQYNRVIQMCHACQSCGLTIPNDRDELVVVSQAAKDSWLGSADSGIVINNMPYKTGGRTLMLVSTTRVGCADKGDCDDRMRTLARMLDAAGIPWLWFNFSDKVLSDMPGTFVTMPPQVDVQPYISRADYLVQLSDQEACSISILEALTNNVPVIATPFPSLYEQGFIDAVHGYVVPYSMDFDANKLLSIPRFYFMYDTQLRIDQWRDLLGWKKKAPKKYTPPQYESVRVLRRYHDVALNRMMSVGEVIAMPTDRTTYLVARDLVERV